MPEHQGRRPIVSIVEDRSLVMAGLAVLGVHHRELDQEAARRTGQEELASGRTAEGEEACCNVLEEARHIGQGAAGRMRVGDHRAEAGIALAEGLAGGDSVLEAADPEAVGSSRPVAGEEGTDQQAEDSVPAAAEGNDRAVAADTGPEEEDTAAGRSLEVAAALRQVSWQRTKQDIETS